MRVIRPSTIELREIGDDADKRVADRLYPLYLHELSRYTTDYTLDENALWEPNHLLDWIEGVLQHAFLIRIDGIPAGFSFVAQAPFEHMLPGCDYQVSEFFVAQPFRGRGAGAAAAKATFDHYRGKWAVSELRDNDVAHSFWRSVIASYTGGKFYEETAGGEVIQRFSNL